MSALAALLLISQSAPGDIIPANRIRVWEGMVGVEGGIPDSTTMTVYTNLTSSATLAQINAALAACPSNKVVQLGAGTYSLGTDSLVIPNGVVLRGAGMTNTVLVSTKDLNGAGGCIVVMGSDPLAAWPNFNFNGVVNWTNGFSQGTSNIMVSSVSGLAVGRVIGLDQLNNGTDVTGASLEGCDGGMGEQGGRTTGHDCLSIGPR